jgi:hypothetical protein
LYTPICAQATEAITMAGIALTTRISRAALERLRARAKSADLGPSAYASRLLENVLLGREGAQLGTEPLPRGVQRELGAELIFVSLALRKFLEKQPGLVPKMRRDARALARDLFTEGPSPTDNESSE